MTQENGIPVAGGPSDALTRERASATPTRSTRIERTRARASFEQAPPLTTSLRDLQEWFAAAVMHPVDVRDGVRGNDLSSRHLDAGDVERVVRPSRTLSGIERIEIYHQAYRARLVECLADDYPALRHAFGEEGFECLCHAYIAGHPSRSPNLNFFGRHMSAFCRTRPEPLCAFGSDLAALEWAMVEVLHESLAPPLSEAALAKVPPADWPRARFDRSRSVRVLPLAHPANAYFQEFNTGGDPPVPGPEWSATAVFRDGATIWRMNLSRAMHELLAALYEGAPLGQALDDLVGRGAVTDDEAPNVMAWFRDWVRYGFFREIELA